jgi:hypothetical protein
MMIVRQVVLLIAAFLTGGAASLWLVEPREFLAWRFVSDEAMTDYVVGILICKEDVALGAQALAQLDRTYGTWRRDLLPEGVYRWVTQCQELGQFPEFGPDFKPWLG